jgi:hypothetical protein
MLAACASLAAASAHAGCSLGLDASLIGAAADAASESGDAPGGDTEASPMDAPPSDGGVVIPVGQCQTDADCAAEAKNAGACIQANGAKCDPTFHVCLFDVCPAGPCKSAICDQSMKTCSVPTSYGFYTTHFSVTYGGTGPDGPYWSIAAVYPYLFIITNNGAVAYRVDDPMNNSPPMIPVQGFTSIPEIVVAAGRRVMFFKSVVGKGPGTYRQSVSWIDVPNNPFITSFTIDTAFIGTAETNFQEAFSDRSKGAWSIYGPPSKFLPAVDLVPPLVETPPITTYPNTGLDPNAGMAAASGSRLVASRYDGMNDVPQLTLITNAGTSNAQAGSEADFNGAGMVAPQWIMATGDDGAVAWSIAPYAIGDAGPIGIASTRVGILLNDANDSTFETKSYVDIESYPYTPGGRVVGAPAWVDKNTLLVTAAAAGDMTLNTTSVQVMTKTPPALVAGVRQPIPIDPGSIGVASSGGFGYVLASDDPKNETATVYVFAPACGGGGGG